jgi:hypothetical protein
VLLGTVVDVAFEASSFRVVRRDDPSPGGAQLVGPQRELLHALLQISREPDVADDDARLRGEILQEFVLGSRERFVRAFADADLARSVLMLICGSCPVVDRFRSPATTPAWGAPWRARPPRRHRPSAMHAILGASSAAYARRPDR